MSARFFEHAARGEISPLAVIRQERVCDVVESMSFDTTLAPTRGVRVFSAELRKARSFPAIPRTVVIGACALLAATAWATLQSSQFIAQGREDALNGLAPQDLPILLLHYGQVVPILLGAWVVGQDVPLASRRMSMLATAQRGALVLAKLVMAALVSLIAGLLCSVAALLPLMISGGGSNEMTVSLGPYGWIVGYWILIAVVSASAVALVRDTTLAVVPILVWTLGLSDLISAKLSLSGALDQVFKGVYLPHGQIPELAELLFALLQVIALAFAAVVATVRRDVQ